MQPVPNSDFEPKIDRSYFVFCPEHGGWHVGKWWTANGQARWVLAYDESMPLLVSHVTDVPPDAMLAFDIARWTVSQTDASN